MRDTEAETNMNELRQRIVDLNREWQLHDQACKTIRENKTPNASSTNTETYEIIAHELVAMKLREAQTDCDNKILSQQVMDVETQKQVLVNQMKRQEEEIQRIKLDLEQSQARENELRTQLNDMQNHIH